MEMESGKNEKQREREGGSEIESTRTWLVNGNGAFHENDTLLIVLGTPLAALVHEAQVELGVEMALRRVMGQGRKVGPDHWPW